MQYGLIILVQGFCLLKIEITQFPDGFRLNPLNWGIRNLVPRRSLLPRCPREVWERAGERTPSQRSNQRSRRISLGDVTAHGRVQD